MNNRQLGRAHERACKKVLEDKGWLVHLTDMPQRFKKHQDIFSIEEPHFGGFDIMAVKAGMKMFIQVKTDDAWKKNTLERMKWFKETYLTKDDIVQLWNWQKKKHGWEIFLVSDDIWELG